MIMPWRNFTSFSDCCSPSVGTVTLVSTTIAGMAAESLAVATLSTIALGVSAIGSLLLSMTVAVFSLAVLVVGVAAAAEVLVVLVVVEDSGAGVSTSSTVATERVGAADLLGGLTETGDVTLDAAEDVVGVLALATLSSDSRAALVGG